jgi:hypothetical protein
VTAAEQLPLFRAHAAAKACRFYLGTHRPDWLAKVGVPLFVSRRQLARYKRLPRAIAPWALDSGGFTELAEHGRWTLTPAEYVAEVRRYAREVGGLAWAAIQDWMCEPQVIHGLVVERPAKLCPACAKAKRRLSGKAPTMRVTALAADERPAWACLACDHTELGARPRIRVRPWREWAARTGAALAAAVARADALGIDAVVAFHGTGLSVDEHQRRTLENWQELRTLAPEIPWAPVIQGWELIDYMRHAEAYEAAGTRLATLPIVGVGSVCRRQHSAQAESIFRVLWRRGIAIHGFGLKQKGLARSAQYLASADSLAWSYNGRRNAPLEGCPHSRSDRPPKNCANCAPFALEWRARLIETTPGVA